MPDTTITSFPIQAKNPKDRPVTSLTWSDNIVFVLQHGTDPKSITRGEFAKILEDFGCVFIKGVAIDDDDAISQGMTNGDWYELKDETNVQSGSRTLRKLK
jgi:hypothetical protein